MFIFAGETVMQLHISIIVNKSELHVNLSNFEFAYLCVMANNKKRKWDEKIHL